MSGKVLSSRGIVGEFYARLEQDIGASWVPRISWLNPDSDMEVESYKWLGMSPAMREWVGGRQAKGLRDNGFDIRNKTFEATLEILVDWIRRDKTGQIMVRINEMADRVNAHWAKLLSQLLIDGEATACYDAQYFFDTDHSEGASGSQSNDLTLDIATATAPTAGEMETAILNAIQAIIGFKDDQGEPMNENARAFLVMVPVPFMAAAAGALGSQIIVDSSTSRSNRILTLGSIGGFQVELAVNARLTWTTKFATFRTDAETAALIRQEEEPVSVSALAEGSEEEFKNNRHLYGVKAIRNAGYGLWQRSALTTFS